MKIQEMENKDVDQKVLQEQVFSDLVEKVKKCTYSFKYKVNEKDHLVDEIEESILQKPLETYHHD